MRVACKWFNRKGLFFEWKLSTFGKRRQDQEYCDSEGLSNDWNQTKIACWTHCSAAAAPSSRLIWVSASLPSWFPPGTVACPKKWGTLSVFFPSFSISALHAFPSAQIPEFLHMPRLVCTHPASVLNKSTSCERKEASEAWMLLAGAHTLTAPFTSRKAHFYPLSQARL